MGSTQQAGTRDWVGIGTLVIAAASLLAAPVVYLNFTLHQIDNRLIKIETRLGIAEPGVSVSQR